MTNLSIIICLITLLCASYKDFTTLHVPNHIWAFGFIASIPVIYTYGISHLTIVLIIICCLLVVLWKYNIIKCGGADIKSMFFIAVMAPELWCIVIPTSAIVTTITATLTNKHQPFILYLFFTMITTTMFI